MQVTHAQNYGNIWQFGNNVGLDFNNCIPNVVSGSNVGFEGCSSFSDTNGQLLFYTNSDKVWNRLHNEMPNGNLITTSGSLSQVLIIPKPLSSQLYYILTVNQQAGSNFSFQYHEVDMLLNGGLGDVSNKNINISTINVTEQVCATYHTNGVDIWVVTHEYGTSNFLAFLVTSSGISVAPIVSNVGPAHKACTFNLNARGEIKFSPDGTRLAFNANGIGGVDSTNILCLFDFDKSTGIISNPINLPYSGCEFGLSFSPDNSKLYGATWVAVTFTSNYLNYLYQFDLSAGNAAAIINSKMVVDSMQESYGSLKIGPDGKIYVREASSNYLGVINFPNQSALACNYIKNGLFIGTQGNQYGLNNYIEYTQYCTVTDASTENTIERGAFFAPNPFCVKTVLKASEELINATLILYNVFGEKVKEYDNISGLTFTFYTNNLASGIYLCKLIENNVVVSTNKLFILD